MVSPVDPNGRRVESRPVEQVQSQQVQQPAQPAATQAPQRPQDTFEAGNRRQGVASIMSDAQAAGYQAGFSGKEIAQLGDKLPDALNAKSAIDRGDWRGAFESIARIGPGAPDATQRLSEEAVAKLPEDVQGQLESVGIRSDAASKLAGTLPAVVDAATALDKGDWKSASAQAIAISEKAPWAAQALGNAIVNKLPLDEQYTLADVGIKGDAVKQLGANVALAVQGAEALQKGDWKLAALDAQAISKDSPFAARQLNREIADSLPAEVRSGLEKIGLQPQQISHLGNSLPAVAAISDALGKGDWQNAAAGLRSLSDAPARLQQQLTSAVLEKVPQAAKDSLAKIGVSSDELRQLGAGLPNAAAAADALAKGDWQAAAANAQIAEKANPTGSGVLDKLQGAVLNAIPKDVREAFEKVGFNKADLKELGNAAPKAWDALQAVSKGDFRAANAAIDAVGEKAPNATRKLGQVLENALPQSVKDGLTKLGIDATHLNEARRALPEAIDASNALAKGDWRGAIKGLQAIEKAAPNLSRRVGDAISSALPKDARDALSSVGIDARGIRELGTALPSAVDAAQSIAKGDWRKAGEQLDAVRQQAPYVLGKLGDKLNEILPKEVTDAAKRFGFAAEHLPELGKGLGDFSDALGAMKKGDWRAAAGFIEAAGKDAPSIQEGLGRELEKILPANVQANLKQLGTSALELGKAMPAAMDTVDALKAGDWRKAATSIEAVRDATPETREFLEKQLDKVLPPDAKAALEKVGSTALEAGKALPSVVDAVNNLEKGDWKAAVKDWDQIRQAAPETTKWIEDKLDKIVPQNVKDAVKTAGTTIGEVGAALPHATEAIEALKKGDWKGAVKDINDIAQSAPNVVKYIKEGFDKLVPQDVKDGLSKLGVGASEIWRLGGKMNDAVDLVNQLKAGNSVAAFDSLSKVVGDPNLKTKIESQLGLPAGGLDAALQKNLINLGNLKLNGVIGQVTPDGKVGPSSVPLTGQEIAGGSFDVGGSVFSASGSVGKPGDAFQAQGSIDLLKAEAYGNGSVKFDPSNFTFGATGKVGAKLDLLDAQGSAELNYGIGSTKAEGSVRIGANAEAQGTVAVDPMHGTLAADIDAEAFAGVQAGAKISETLGPVAADAKASVSAGVGVDFGLDVGFQKGKFSFKADIGAALGIGFDLEIGFSVDVGKIVSTIGDVLEKPAKFVGDAIKKAGEAVGWLGSKVVDAGKAVVNGVVDAGKAVVGGVVDAAKAVGGGIVDAGKSVINAVGDFFSGW